MTPDALTADALYYLPDISGIAVLEYIGRSGHYPELYVFVNVAERRARRLWAHEVGLLHSDMNEAKKRQAQLLRTQLKAHAKRRYRGRNRAAGRSNGTP